MHGVVGEDRPLGRRVQERASAWAGDERERIIEARLDGGERLGRGPMDDARQLILATPEASTRMLAALVTSALTPPRPRKLLVRAPGAVPASP